MAVRSRDIKFIFYPLSIFILFSPPLLQEKITEIVVSIILVADCCCWVCLVKTFFALFYLILLVGVEYFVLARKYLN